MTNLSSKFFAFLLSSSLLAPISALGAVELQLGQPTDLSSSRVDESGNSFSIGRIYRSAPELRGAREDDTLTFYAPDGTAHSATITKAIDTDRGNRLLNAIADGTTIVAVVNANGDFFSSIRANGDYFQSAIYEGQTVIYDSAAGEIVSNPFLNDQLMPEKLSPGSSEELQANEVTAQADIISVGVLADTASQNAYDVVALVDYFIEVANQSYQDVGVDIVFETVAIGGYTPYLSQSDMSLSLYDISCGSTSCSPFSSDNSSVISWRDANKADLVVQIVRYGTNGGTCGIAWTPGSNGAVDFTTYLKELTYSVNALELPNGTYCPDIVVAHEMGHNFGLGHDRTTGCGTTYYSYACGYKNVSQGFGSVMSYVPSSQYVFGLSNPNLTVNGYPFGVPIGQSGEAFAAQAVANVSYLHSDIYENTTTTTFTVTPSANSGGSISPSSAQSVESGSTVSFTLTPNSNYTIGTISGNCPQGSFNGSTYTTGAITANCSVIANFDPLPGAPTISSITPGDGSLAVAFSAGSGGVPDSYTLTCVDQSASRVSVGSGSALGQSSPHYVDDQPMTSGGLTYPTVRAFHESRAFEEGAYRCATHEHDMFVRSQPNFSEATRAADCSLSETVIDSGYAPVAGRTVVIPLYFHVIYKSDGTGYVSRSRIDDQIAVLNDDFGGTTFGGDSGFDTTIQFELVAVDYVESDDWYTDAGAGAVSEFKSSLAQSPQEYINIYTNDAGGGGVLGYATLPPGSAGTDDDGVVMLHNTIGGRNNGYSVFNQGRTLVHEVGHYLGLLHTFDGGVCSNTYTTQDLIVDTPAQSAPDYGTSASSACGVTSAIENFMNYSDDSAMYTFTEEQTNRMICSQTSYRPDGYTFETPGTFTASGASSPLTVTGLTNGNTYSCSVVATNGAGDSAASAAVTATPAAPTAPGVPTITRTDYGDGEIYLYVTVSDDGGSAVTGYTASCTDGTTTFMGTSTDSPITITGLTNDTAYTCTVTATNAIGTSADSSATSNITPEEGANGLPIWLLYQATQQ